VTVGSVGIDSNDARTIAGWVRATSLTMPNWTNIFGFTDPNSGGGRSFDIQIVGGSVTTTAGYFGIHCYGSGNDHDIMEPDLDWHHLAATYDGTTVQAYADGHTSGSWVIDVNTYDNVQMGKRADNDNYFDGNLD
jgi:hypothetical protein